MFTIEIYKNIIPDRPKYIHFTLGKRINDQSQIYIK